MKVEIKPSSAFGKIKAPPSKSMAHRALILGALTENSVINNVAFSKDIIATIDCLKALGAKVNINESIVEIGGLDIENIPDNAELFCNESGSTLRFLLPLCMASGKRIKLYGARRLFERPLTVYEDIAKQQDIAFEKGENSVTVCGNLKTKEYFIKGDISSQFITGVLFALPLLSGESKITVTGRFESASYIDLTVKAMTDFGIKIQRKDNSFVVLGKQKPKNINYTVEGDCSNAAFLEAFNYLGGKVSVEGLNSDTLQGDRVYKGIFEGIKNGEKTFDLSDCPDLAPVCFAVAAVLGGCKFTGTKRLKIKESDRGNAMKQELKKFSVDVLAVENSVTVKKCVIQKPNKVLSGHNDHRIVMALSLLCSITGGVIDDAEAVSKSYPEFFGEIKKIGIDVNEIN